MKTIYKLFVVAIFFAFSTNSFAFTDVQSGDQYSAAIYFLEDLGILEGYVDGEVKPNKSVTRTEFLKMVLEYNEESVGDMSECFADSIGHWGEKYICYAADKGWIDGYDSETFGPSREVNFVEAMKMIKNVVYSDWLLDPLEENEEWYFPYVDFLVGNVDLCEIDSYSEILTRGMIAELLHNVELAKDSNWVGKNCREEGATYEDLGMSFYKYRGYIYYDTGAMKRLHLADYDTFVRLHEHYGIDKDRVFLGANEVVGADPSTFEVIKYIYFQDRAYAIDKDSVYYGTDLLEGVDVDTFEFIEADYVKDVNGVYFQDNWTHAPLVKIEGADPATFELLDPYYWYAKDKDNVFYAMDLVEEADPGSIMLLGGDSSGNFFYANQYARDDNYVYCGQDEASTTHDVKILEGANPDTFGPVNEKGYFSEVRDGDKVYEDCELVVN